MDRSGSNGVWGVRNTHFFEILDTFDQLFEMNRRTFLGKLYTSNLPRFPRTMGP